MKRILFAVLPLLSGLIGHAQSAAKISGIIIDGNKKTVESATISLLQAKDSSLKKFSVADKNGHYKFDGVGVGNYLVSVTAIGHTKAYSEPVLIKESTSTVILKPIEIVPFPKALAGVTVTAKKPFIEQKIDRTLINVESSVSNAGATALEVLEKSPGVTLDKDGNISLKGKAGVMVMMDGRPAYLSGADLTNYLKNLPASAIDQIEIMTNPSAKFDAAGNAGIINIKSKKNRQKGLNGIATSGYSQGIRPRFNNTLNLNYRTGKINLFANANYNHNNNAQRLDILRNYSDAGTKTLRAIFEQTSHLHHQSDNSSLKIGADYFANKTTTLGVVASAFVNPENQWGTNTSYLKNSVGVVDSIVYSESSTKERWTNKSVNLNFRKQLDTTGSEVTSDLDYITYGSRNNAHFSNLSYEPDWTKKGADYLHGNLPVQINIYSGKVDYSHRLKEEGRVEAGLKTSYVNTDNDANYFKVYGTTEVMDSTKTNHFKYTENIQAAYLNFNKSIKKLAVQAGLRYELTSYRGLQYGSPDLVKHPDSSFHKTYSSLFPTLFVSYQADKNNQFAVSLGRRIDRPQYQALNPFLFFLDRYTYEAGNPFLKPQFSNNLELTHSYKNRLTTTVNYNRTKNEINETFETVGYATIVRKANIATQDAAGISVSAQMAVQKWWNAMIYTNLNYTKFRGQLYGEALHIEATNLTMNINNQFHFNKGWSAELSGFYRGKGIWGQIVTKPMGQVSAGVSKQVLKEKGTFKFNVRDVFRTNAPQGHISMNNVEAYFKNTFDSRVANLSFSYRFGKPVKGAQPRRKTGGASDEQNRVKTNNNN